MNWTSDKILSILDACAESFTFPVLDNGYLYLAATRVSVYRDDSDWAIVIEVFGFSPRSGIPDTQIYTFSSNLHNRNLLSDYATDEAYTNYLVNNPFNESRFIYPFDNSDWINEDDCEQVNDNGECLLRGKEVLLPSFSECGEIGIELEETLPLTFEVCRYLAFKYRELVLCNETERRVSVDPNLTLLFQLDKWTHPDISGGELPSSSASFKKISEAIVDGSKPKFIQSKKDNSHWEHWPEAGTI